METNLLLEIVRVGQSELGTFGVIRWGQIPFALTLERPWLDNASNISCIPAGHYLCRRIKSEKFGETFEITNVPRRFGILFHKGNKIDDSHGCILVAEEFGGTFTAPIVLSSAKGFGEFLEVLKGKVVFDLVIHDAPKTPTRNP